MTDCKESVGYWFCGTQEKNDEDGAEAVQNEQESQEYKVQAQI
jgi:hypothetical protein